MFLIKLKLGARCQSSEPQCYKNMAQCPFPFVKDGIPVPCGKCHDCRARRISGWSFRLLKEAERSSSALFVTLTYDSDHVPITRKNWMTLQKSDLQKFFKRLRKLTANKIKYYAAGEYGDTRKRPHYHIILFNSYEEDVCQSWNLGEIHIGKLTPASAAYTLKYISKPSKIPLHKNDDRVPEFSVMSKRLGDNYLTENIIKWHKADYLERFYVPMKDGKKIALPRYYRDKIFSRYHLEKIVIHMQKKLVDEFSKYSVEKRNREFKKSENLRIAKSNKYERRNTNSSF